MPVSKEKAPKTLVQQWHFIAPQALCKPFHTFKHGEIELINGMHVYPQDRMERIVPWTRTI